VNIAKLQFGITTKYLSNRRTTERLAQRPRRDKDIEAQDWDWNRDAGKLLQDQTKIRSVDASRPRRPRCKVQPWLCQACCVQIHHKKNLLTIFIMITMPCSTSLTYFSTLHHSFQRYALHNSYVYGLDLTCSCFSICRKATKARTAAASPIHFKFDYFNSLLFNLPATQTNRLQLVVNSAACASVSLSLQSMN